MSDLIRRKDAIDSPVKMISEGLEWIPVYHIKELPSAEQGKKGKWKGYKDGDPNWQRDDGSPIFLICSECYGTVINNGSAHWNFCPNCGADMREGDSE